MAVAEERLEGYSLWERQDPFEDYVGPLYYKQEDGQYKCAFVVNENHVNGQKGIHGGMLMTFADFALFIIAQDHLKESRAVTVSFNSEFTAVAHLGDFVQATGEVVHETRGMLFMRGTVFSDEAVLLSFSSVLKKVRPRVQS